MSEALGVVALGGEVVRIDVDVGIERDDRVVDRARLLGQRVVGRLTGTAARPTATARSASTATAQSIPGLFIIRSHGL